KNGHGTDGLDKLDHRTPPSATHTAERGRRSRRPQGVSIPGLVEKTLKTGPAARTGHEETVTEQVVSTKLDHKHNRPKKPVDPTQPHQRVTPSRPD
ncbi:hypothetical protein ACFU7D_25915, partial [Nocardioides sp. NPDC057577]|uniref:hypothetical protein n=1 Tax=Nocardioides sp. NPDC057577 TaxID=3346171 RepID=UPI00366CC9D8